MEPLRLRDLPPHATKELEVRSSMAEGSPPGGVDTQIPLHAQEITLPLIIVVWVRTQCEVEILAIHTIEMIPKSMILMLIGMVKTPIPTQY